MKIMVSTILAAYMPTAGAIVIHATAAADPPNPELPETFSCEFNLTQLMDPSGPSGMTFDNHATGSTQQDAAGKGRSRLSMSMTTITTLPAAVFVTTTNNITDYEAGESWVQTCSNSTGSHCTGPSCPKLPPFVCNCVHSKVTGQLTFDANTSGWSYAGDATVGGELCTEWVDNSGGGAPVTATYFVSKAAPYVLRKTLVKSAAVTMEQGFSNWALGAPPPSTWDPPPEWKCPKATSLPGSPDSEANLHGHVAQVAATSAAAAAAAVAAVAAAAAAAAAAATVAA